MRVGSLRDYWILGFDAQPRTRRWSVLDGGPHGPTPGMGPEWRKGYWDQ